VPSDTKPDFKLGWVIAYVDDPRAADEFYGRVLGL
jgi:hypothetical protein